MSKEIERVQYFPDNMSFYEWCCEEYEKIKSQQKEENNYNSISNTTTASRCISNLYDMFQ